MSLIATYKANRKGKKNVAKGVKELQEVEKLTTEILEKIDNVFEDKSFIEENADVKEVLELIKGIISIDLSKNDNMGVSNYLFGRLLRTYVVSEYGIDKKRFQLEFLDRNKEILKTEALEDILNRANEILEKNIKIAENLLEVTRGYAKAKKDLLPRNKKEFDQYIAEYNNYLDDKNSNIKKEIEKLNELNLKENTIFKENLAEIIKEINIQNNINEDNILNKEDYIKELFAYDMKLNKYIFKLKDMVADIEDSDLKQVLESMESILGEYNRLNAMVCINIYKIIKPFDKKYELSIEDYNLEESINSDYKKLKDSYTLINDFAKDII